MPPLNHQPIPLVSLSHPDECFSSGPWNTESSHETLEDATACRDQLRKPSGELTAHADGEG